MQNNVTPVPVPTPIAIRIVKLLCPANSDAQTIEEAFKVDEIIQLPALQQALTMMRQKVDFEASQRQEADRLKHAAETLVREGEAKLAGRDALIAAMDGFIVYLSESERHVLGLMLEHNFAYPPGVIEKGVDHRRRIAGLTPLDLIEKLKITPTPVNADLAKIHFVGTGEHDGEVGVLNHEEAETLLRAKHADPAIVQAHMQALKLGGIVAVEGGQLELRVEEKKS
jgi:hypothetical protein